MVHTQAEFIDRVTKLFEVSSSRLAAREEIDALNYEVMNNLVVEMTRLSIEMKNHRMRVESVAGRLDFNERRARALEGAVQYRGGAPAASPDGDTGQADGAAPKRRRRRRGRRRPPRPEGAAPETAAAENAAPESASAENAAAKTTAPEPAEPHAASETGAPSDATPAPSPVTQTASADTATEDGGRDSVPTPAPPAREVERGEQPDTPAADKTDPSEQ